MVVYTELHPKTKSKVPYVKSVAEEETERNVGSVTRDAESG